MPACSHAPDTTSSSICASVLSVRRTIGETLQPMMAMSSGLSPGCRVLTSADPVHEIGVVDVGLAVRHPTDETLHRRPSAAGHAVLALRCPYRAESHADADVIVGYFDERLV